MNEINLNLAIANNRRPLSLVGSTLGAQYAKPEAVSCLPDYDKKIAEAKTSGDLQLVLNRPPRKLRIRTEDIVSAEITADLDGTIVVIINKDKESELRIPVSADMTKAGIVTDDAVRKALKGEKNLFFNDVKKLTSLLNNLNQNELNRIDSVIADLQLAKKRIESAIAESSKKAEQYEQESGKSSRTSVLENGNGSVEINVEV